MGFALEESYAYCRRVARTRARNFYYSFVLLPPARRNAMCAMYAFMRYSDDLSDEAGPRDPSTVRGVLQRWRLDLDRALAGDYGTHPAWPALHDSVRRYGIPRTYLHEMIDGVSSDLEPRQFQTFDELRAYCHQVAGVVGLTIIHILGFESPEAIERAEKCGLAFQLTNILRDIREDAGRGRIYLPREHLDRFGVRPTDLTAGVRSPEVLSLLRYEASLARAHYQEAWPLVDLVSRSTRPSLWALIQIYYRLLGRIEESEFDVFARRIRLPAWEKAGIVLRAAAAPITGWRKPE